MQQHNYPRVAFFPDNFHEVNGVALPSRHLTAFARRNELPFLAVYCAGSVSHPEDEHPLSLPLYGHSGFIARDDQDFIERVLWLMSYPAEREIMARAARLQVEAHSWDRVFQEVYKVYVLACSERMDCTRSDSSGISGLSGNSNFIFDERH